MYGTGYGLFIRFDDDPKLDRKFLGVGANVKKQDCTKFKIANLFSSKILQTKNPIALLSIPPQNSG